MEDRAPGDLVLASQLRPEQASAGPRRDGLHDLPFQLPLDRAPYSWNAGGLIHGTKW